MSKDKVCHLLCNECGSQTTGNSLKECLDNIKCLSDGGPLDDTCRIVLSADGKAVFEINQKIPDDYKGETNLSGTPDLKKSKSPSKPKETEKNSNSQKDD